RQTPWVQGLDVRDCRDIAEVFHDEVRAFVEWISPKPHEDEIRGLVVERITQVIVDRFPDAEITPFGSYGTKLYLPHGDIDLVIQSKSMGYSDKHTVLQALSRTITYAGIASKVSIIAKAKVPIVKFITTGEYGRFQVDISINHVNGIHAGRIMNGFLHDMRANLALRSLVFVVKAFLNQRGMNEVYTGGLSSYSVICLVISFIQMHPKIRNQEIDPDTNVGVLVMEFFEFYGCYHNYEEVGISLREGGYYYSKRRRNWLNPAKPRSLSIEDPADPSNDISAGSWAYQKVRATFAGAYEMLTASIYLQAMNFKALQEGTMTPLRGGYHPEDWSVLSSIIAIKPEVVNHRQLVLEVYESQRLHQELGVAPR
ncbi:Nucleotidyltransferase, partial [Fistulina hepatica ATCC 64428]